MKKYANGQYIEMTADEIAALEDAAARAEAEEKHRPLGIAEVQEMLVRAQINTLSVDDATALRMRDHYPAWADLAAEGYTAAKAGFRFTYGGELYKTAQPNLTFAVSWVPGVGTESLYVRIDEQHDGDKYDPIPAARGMEYEYGKHYLDQEDGKTYLCERIGEQSGGKIVLQYLPHELVGQYFTAVE